MNGYIYTRTSKTKNRIQLKCRRNISNQCKASASTDLNYKDFQCGELPHNHAENYGEIKALEVRSNLKWHALLTKEKTNSCVDASLHGLDSEARAALPSESSMRRMVHRLRSVPQISENASANVFTNDLALTCMDTSQ